MKWTPLTLNMSRWLVGLLVLLVLLESLIYHSGQGARRFVGGAKLGDTVCSLQAGFGAGVCHEGK